MIRPADSVKRYSAAKSRFLKPGVMNFFAREFPRFFGPRMREKLAEELITLFETLAPDTTRMHPGQILWNALDKNTRGDSPNRRYVPVVLSIITAEDIDQLVQGVAMSTIAKQAIARIIREAYDQGGVLSMRDIGLFLLRHPSQVSRMRIHYEQEHECTLPHTGVLHDMGSCLSHKTQIIRKVVLEKKDPAAVARECQHSQRAVDQYLREYHRIKTAYHHNPDIEYIHLVTGVAKHVVTQYIDLINQ